MIGLNLTTDQLERLRDQIDDELAERRGGFGSIFDCGPEPEPEEEAVTVDSVHERALRAVDRALEQMELSDNAAGEEAWADVAQRAAHIAMTVRGVF